MGDFNAQSYFIDESLLDTVLAENMSFDGDIFFARPFLVKGTIKGSIKSAGDLYIGEKAYVEAQIKAGSVYVQGHVRGDIYAENRVEVASSATVEGNIVTPEIVLERGCKLNGDCRMPEQQGSSDDA